MSSPYSDDQCAILVVPAWVHGASRAVEYSTEGHHARWAAASCNVADLRHVPVLLVGLRALERSTGIGIGATS